MGTAADRRSLHQPWLRHCHGNVTAGRSHVPSKGMMLCVRLLTACEQQHELPWLLPDNLVPSCRSLGGNDIHWQLCSASWPTRWNAPEFRFK